MTYSYAGDDDLGERQEADELTAQIDANRRRYDQDGRLIYYRAPDGYEEWYNPDAPSGQQTIRASAWDGYHDITHSQEA